MERIIAFIGLLAICLASLNAQGIDFLEGSWSNAVIEAKKNKKYLFVEVYGDWCAVCKKIEKNIFSQPEVGSFFNKAFINIRLNGDDLNNQQLLREWRITTYPTLLIVGFDENEITRHSGTIHALDLIGFGTNVLAYNKEMDALGENPTQEKLKTFLLNYINVAEKNKNKYLERYFQSIDLSQLSHKVDVKILNSAITQANPKMIHNLFVFYSMVDNGNRYNNALEQLDIRLQEMAESSFHRDSILKYHQYRNMLWEFYQNQYPYSSIEINDQLDDDLLNLYGTERDMAAYALLAKKTMQNRFLNLLPAQINRKDGFLNAEITPNNPRKLAGFITHNINKICLTYYRFYNNDKNLEDALIWIKHSIHILPSARSYLIASGLCNKLEKHSEGKSFFNKAQDQKDFPEQAILFEDLITMYSEK